MALIYLSIGSINFPARAEKHIYSSQSAALVTFKLLSVPDGCEGSDGLFLHSWQLAFPVRGKLGHDDGTHAWTRARSATRPTARRATATGQWTDTKCESLRRTPRPTQPPGLTRVPDSGVPRQAAYATPRGIWTFHLLIGISSFSFTAAKQSIHPSQQASNQPSGDSINSDS